MPTKPDSPRALGHDFGYVSYVSRAADVLAVNSGLLLEREAIDH